LAYTPGAALYGATPPPEEVLPPVVPPPVEEAPPPQQAAPTYQEGAALYGAEPAPQQQQQQAAPAPTGYQEGAATSYTETAAPQAQEQAPAEPAPPVDKGYIPGTNPILDTTFAIGNKVGDFVEMIGGKDLRQNLGGLAPPVQEVAEADGVKDKLISASNYWDRPAEQGQAAIGQQAIEQKEPDKPYSITSVEGLKEAGSQFIEQIKDYKEHPEHILEAIPQDSAESALFSDGGNTNIPILSDVLGDEPGFNDWAAEHPELVAASKDDPDGLYQQYLTDIGYTWEEGGLLGLGRGLGQQALTDESLIPTLGAGAVANTARRAGVGAGIGVARGIEIPAKALNTALQGPEDLLIDKGLGVLGKVLPDSIRSIFEPGEEGKRVIQAQGLREIAEDTAITRDAAGRPVDQTVPLPGAATLTGVPNTPLTTPAPATVPPTSPASSPQTSPSTTGLGTPFGARTTRPTLRGAASSSIWDFDPVRGVWTRDGQLPTKAHLKEAEEELLDTPPDVIDGYEKAELLGAMQTDPRRKTLVRMRSALTQGEVLANGQKVPYLVDDWNPGQPAAAGTPAAARRAAGWRHIDYLKKRIDAYGEAEIVSQLQKLNRTKYRGRYGNTQPVEIWYDNMREHLQVAIKRSTYDGPVNLGTLHKNVNGAWVPGRQLTANPQGTGKVLNIDDFEPDMGTWQALQASAHNNLRVMTPPPARPASAAQQVAPLTTPVPPTQMPVQQAAQAVNMPAPPVSTVVAPPPTTPVRWKVPFSRSNAQAKTDYALHDLGNEFDGLAPPDGHIPFLRRKVGDKTFFRVITDEQDGVYRLLDIIQGRQMGMPDELDGLLKTYEKDYTKLYGKDAVPDFQNMGTREANAFTADVATQRWLDSLPALKTRQTPGMLGSIKRVSSDIASFRSGVGLHNWAAAPRQFVVQHSGNMMAGLLTKPAVITRMLNPRTATALYKAAADARKGLKPGQRAKTSGAEAVEKLNLPFNSMVSGTDKNMIRGSTRQMQSSLAGPLNSAKRVLAPEFLGDFAAIPDGMFRDGVMSETFFPAIRTFQKNYHKDAGTLAHEWANNKGGFTVPANQVAAVVKKAFDARWDKGMRVSTLNQVELEEAIYDAFKHLPNANLTRNFANRVARDYKTKLNTEYQAAAKEVKRLAFSWDSTRADDALGHVFLYQYWTSRAATLYAKELLKNPWMAANFARLAQALNEEAETMGYPHWMQGFSRLLASPGGSVLFANPLNLLGTMLTFAEWQYGEDPAQLKEDLTMLGRARGLWPGFLNPLWDGLAWEFGFYGGESARAPQDPTGAERIFRDGARVLNLAKLNGHLPDWMMSDEMGNPVLLSEKPITELAIKFYTAVGGIVRDNPQPIPNLYASQQSQTKAYLLQDLIADHPDWNSEQVERTANVMADQAALGQDVPDEWLAAERRRVMADMQGPEYEFLPEPIRGLVGGAIRAISPMAMLNRPELDLGMRNPPIGAAGRDPQALPAFPDDYDGSQFRGQIYNTNELNDFKALSEDWWGDSALTDAGKKRTAIVKATNTDGEVVNGVHYSQEQIMAMTDSRRFALAKEALEELGYTQADIDAQYEMRRVLEEANPELRAYHGYIDAAENHSGGIEGFVDELYETSPAFKRAMDDNGKEPFTPDWYSAYDREDIFLAATGTRTSLYDPLNVPEGIETGEFAAEREASQAAFEDNSYIAKTQRSVNEAMLAQELLEREYPGYGLRVGNGNLDPGIWKHMQDVWKANDIDTTYITKTSHYGAQYVNWLINNPGVEDASLQAYLDSRPDDGSNTFADGTATVEGEPTQEAFDLDGPVDMTRLSETFGLAPPTQSSSAQIVFPDADVDLRSQPGGSRITILPTRTPLRLMTTNGQWAQVQGPGGFEGWVPLSVLRAA
jgi:hypothetical protein